MNAQIGIIGAGPAGLVLAHLLAKQNITSLVVEKSSANHVAQRQRAGVLEPGTVDTLHHIGLGEHIKKNSLTHGSFGLVFNDHSYSINLANAGGCVSIYGQTELQKILNTLPLSTGHVVYNVQNAALHKCLQKKPAITYTKDDRAQTVLCDFIVGCDGFHGLCRQTLPYELLQPKEQIYPYAWLGILAEAPPLSHEIVYVNHVNGFSLHSMRSETISRNYIQCAPDTNINDWSDDKIWNELQIRLGSASINPVKKGNVLDKSIIPMRSSIVGQARFGQIFLAGDAAHILPPTGAKGLNLAISDVKDLADAFGAYYHNNTSDLLNTYSTTCLERANKALAFSLHMTHLLHKNELSPHAKQIEALNDIVTSQTQSKQIAKKYLGLGY